MGQAAIRIDLKSNPPQQRAERRSRANMRVVSPVAREIRDPLSRVEAGKSARMGRGAIVLISATVLHVLILLGFVAANALSNLFAEEEAVEHEKTEIAVLDTPEPEAERPPEPEPLPPVESLEPAIAPSDAPPAPAIGISADSTIDGGDGPAFQTGTSLAGPASGNLAQEILRREKVGTKEMVMTGETVDTHPMPLASNRAPAAPREAALKRMRGFVIIQLLIGKDGGVIETKILQSEPAGFFDQAVMDVVPSWRFKPATYRGAPVDLRVDQTIRFDLG